MQTSRKRRLSAEINVVPYIDVMLVLVVIFMTTATIALGVQVDLPESSAQPLNLDAQEEPIQLTVKPDGSLYLNIGPQPDLPLPPDQVIKHVSTVLKHSPQRQVVVSGDKTADYGTIMKAMGLLVQAGAQKVGLQTLPQDES